MVPAARLRRSADIANVRAAGRSLRRTSFAARILRTDARGVRIAVTAPRTLGSSVARNRMRRRVREAFRRALAATRPLPAMDIIVTARPEAATADFRTLEAEAASVLREPLG